jgi:predicted hydrocarbon binding protein
MAGGIEQAIGESANSISYLAGQRLGMRLSVGVPKTADLNEALAALQQLLWDNGCLWRFEPFQAQDRENMVEPGPDGEHIQLVFRDCMIRQTLFCFGHHQKGSLCNLMYGVFAGALQRIMDSESTLEILHAGENACLKQLTIRRQVPT